MLMWQSCIEMTRLQDLSFVSLWRALLENWGLFGWGGATSTHVLAVHHFVFIQLCAYWMYWIQNMVYLEPIVVTFTSIFLLFISHENFSWDPLRLRSSSDLIRLCCQTMWPRLGLCLLERRRSRGTSMGTCHKHGLIYHLFCNFFHICLENMSHTEDLTQRPDFPGCSLAEDGYISQACTNTSETRSGKMGLIQLIY